MNNPVIHLGLAGLGTVGSGLAKIIQENSDWITRRLGRTLKIKTVMVRDPAKARNVVLPPDTLFTTSMVDLLNDPEIDMVELAGGIDFPRTLITRALQAGKPVVTANKALLAEHGSELFELAAANGLGLYYEASVAGGIPIIQTLKESLAANRISSITGILNGTANFIMSEMTEKGEDFAKVLGKAQAKGYAEADPTLDIEGIDAAHKLTILIRLAYGLDFPMSGLTVKGISKVEQFDISLAREFGYRVKLLAQVRAVLGHDVALAQVFFARAKFRVFACADSLQFTFYRHGVLARIHNALDPADGVGVALAHAFAPKRVAAAVLQHALAK